MDRNGPLKGTENDRYIGKREESMRLFATSVGWEFQVRGLPDFKDYVKGTDASIHHVVGEKEGSSYHVDLCELTGRKKTDEQQQSRQQRPKRKKQQASGDA